MVLESHPYIRNATTLETIPYLRTRIINYLERDKVFIRPGEEYSLTPPIPFQSRKHGSASHLYLEWDEPCVSLSKGLKQALQRSIELHDGYSHHKLSTAPTHVLRTEHSPLSALPTPREHQLPIGTSRPLPCSHTRILLRSATTLQAPIGSGRERTHRQSQFTRFTTAASSPLPSTSVLGRYHQVQCRSPLLGVKGRFTVNAKHGGYAVADLTGSHGRRHTAEFIRNDDEVLSRPSASRHSNTWLNPPNDMARVDTSIDKLDDSDRPRCSLISCPDSTITPPHEDPILFRALPNSQRRYTQGLVSDDDGLLAPPTRTNIFRPPPKDLLLSYQSNYIDDTRLHPQSPHPTHRSFTRPHLFKRHPMPIPSHNPFRHPQQHTNNTQSHPVKRTTLLPSRQEPYHLSPPPSQPHHILAPSPKVPNPDMVRYLEHLVDDGADDNDVIVYTASQRSRESDSNHHHPPDLLAHDERDQNQAAATHRGNGYSASGQLGVVNRDGFERFLEERRRLSPPEARYAGGYPARAGVDGADPTPAKRLFGDFPVCEMSIAMGLHDGTPRGRANVTDQTSHGG